MGEPYLQLHLEPSEHIEVSELTGALTALARQYQTFAVQNQIAKKPSDARLLVSSVAPGSIDISLYPDLVDYLAALPMLAPLFDKAELIAKFGKTLKSLFELFKKKKETEVGDEVTIKDCDDAINIVKPIANHGGSQTFNVIHGGVTMYVLTMTAPEASEIMEVAHEKKALLQNADAEIRQRVPMVWKRLDRDATSPEAKTSPDRALIEEIDPKPRAVFFTDEMSAIKKQMIDDEVNPYQNVYFVDVSVSRIADKVVAYRVIGYHGKEELEPLVPAWCRRMLPIRPRCSITTLHLMIVSRRSFLGDGPPWQRGSCPQVRSAWPPALPRKPPIRAVTAGSPKTSTSEK